MKKVLSFVLCLVMVFSLFPAFGMSAQAADPSNPAQVDVGELHMTKNLTQAADGTYTVTLESWATGQTHSETVVQPMDIVLVLDQSGSMADKIPIPPTEGDRVNNLKYRDVRNGNYYVKIGEHYYILHAFQIGNFYFVYYNDGNSNHYIMSWELSWAFTGNPSLSTSYAYYAYGGTEYKYESLSNAANDFISAMQAQQNSDGTPVDHRIAIVGFANDGTITSGGAWLNTEIFDGVTQTNYRNVDNATLQAALKHTNNENDVDDLRASITELAQQGGTCSDKGLDLARQILNARSDADKENRGCAVIMFTDGLPGSGTEPGTGERGMLRYANLAVAQAYELKNVNNAIVCTIGIFNTLNADVEEDEQDDSAVIGTVNRVDYTARDYMISVSSDYPDAQTVQDVPEEVNNQPYESTYYKLASDSAELSRIFEHFAEIITPSTPVTLDDESVLRDVIKSDDFVATPGAAVSAKAVKLSNGAVDTAVTNGLQYSATVPADGVVDVKGFDYSALYHTDGHPGDKLVVTITGLVPTRGGDLLSNNGFAGVYAGGDFDKDPAIKIDSPALNIAEETAVIDFNAKMELASGVTRKNDLRAANGAFDLANSKLTYQLLPEEKLSDRSGSLIVSGVDSTLAFGTDGWKEYRAIPANNIYFDDNLLTETVTVGDGSGWNAGIPQTTGTADAVNNQRFAFTFTGTAIDIYCTTNDSVKSYVQGALYKGDVRDQLQALFQALENGEKITPMDPSLLVQESLFAMLDYSITERLNVPTVHLVAPEYGTYTVYLYAMDGANYKLDGVRVYNALQNNQEAYDGTNEKNAQFFNLRDALINDGQAVTLTVPSADGLEENTDVEALPGVLFLDDPDSVNIEMTEGDGSSTVPAYENQFDAYKDNGPKNEIYLEAGKAITFKVVSQPEGTKYWVGLSAPDAGKNTGTVTVNGTSFFDVTSAVDMYYEITPASDGSVVLRNSGSSMLSITNLKMTCPTALTLPAENGASPFGLFTAKTFRMMANNGVDPQEVVTADPETPVADDPGTPEVDPTGTDDPQPQTLQDMIRELISSFVSSLFRSISRLFGN